MTLLKQDGYMHELSSYSVCRAIVSTFNVSYQLIISTTTSWLIILPHSFATTQPSLIQSCSAENAGNNWQLLWVRNEYKRIASQWAPASSVLIYLVYHKHSIMIIWTLATQQQKPNTITYATGMQHILLLLLHIKYIIYFSHPRHPRQHQLTLTDFIGHSLLYHFVTSPCFICSDVEMQLCYCHTTEKCKQ